MAAPGAQIRLLLVEDVPQVVQYIRGLLSSQDRIKLLDVMSDGRRVVDQIHQLRPDVLMVDALLQGRMNGLQVAESVREAGLDLPIVALTVPQKPVEIGGGMGIARVLTMPFSGYEFMNLLQGVHEAYRAATETATSRVVTVFAPKGGVGKTTLAFNVAVAAAQAGGLKVALVDGNLQFGDLRALLRVPVEAPSIVDLPIDRVQDSDLQEVMWRDPSGIDILLAPPRIEMAEMVTTRDVEKVLSLVRRVYDLVVIDTPTSLTDPVLAFLDASDALLHIVTYESTSLHNTRAMAHTFQAIGYPPQKIRYVLNRSDSTGGFPPQVFEQQLGQRPEFTIVSDGRLVVECNNQGIPFVLADPAARVSQDVLRIAAAVSRPESQLVAPTRR